jgi:hypothetical protein
MCPPVGTIRGESLDLYAPGMPTAPAALRVNGVPQHGTDETALMMALGPRVLATLPGRYQKLLAVKVWTKQRAGPVPH